MAQIKIQKNPIEVAPHLDDINAAAAWEEFTGRSHKPLDRCANGQEPVRTSSRSIS